LGKSCNLVHFYLIVIGFVNEFARVLIGRFDAQNKCLNAIYGQVDLYFEVELKNVQENQQASFASLFVGVSTKSEGSVYRLFVRSQLC
jgi:hypothetical protein